MNQPRARVSKSVRVGVIGAGSYVTAMLLPQFKKAGADFRFSSYSDRGLGDRCWQEIRFLACGFRSGQT